MYSKYTKNLITASCVALSASFAVAQSTPGAQQSAPGTQQSQQQTAPGTAQQSAPNNTSQMAPGSQPGQQNAGTASAQSGQVTEAEKEFVKEALTSSMAEIQSSRMATEKAESEEVKQTAQRMAQDHAQVGQAIQQMAQAKNIETPEQLDTKQQQKLTKLNQATEGEAFEKEYVKETVKAHEKSIKMFESAAKEVQDPDLKNLAQQALPLLERHAQQIAQLPGATEHMSEETRKKATQAQPETMPGQTTQQQPGATNPGATQQPGASNPGATQQPGQTGTQTSPQQPTYSGQQPASQGNM